MGEVTVTRVGTQAVVRLYGDVDAAMREVLAGAVRLVTELLPTRVTVDLDLVTSVDTVGIAFLQELWRDCGERARPLRCIEVPAQVRDTLVEHDSSHLLRARRTG